MSIAVYIGRFQPFHKGHEQRLIKSLKEHKCTVLLIGSANSERTLKNPFTYEERKEIITQWFINNEEHEEFRDLIIQPINDYTKDNHWVDEVYKKIIKCTNRYNIDLCDVKLIGSNNHDITDSYINLLNAMDITLSSDVLNIRATDIRNKYFSTNLKLLELDNYVPIETLNFLYDVAKTDSYKKLSYESANESHVS